MCLNRRLRPAVCATSWTLPRCFESASSRAWNGLNRCGDLNLAHEMCRWIRPPFALDFKAQVWYTSKTSERSVRQCSRRAAGWRKPEKKRESSLLLPELQRCLTSSAWPSEASLVFDPSELLPPIDARVLINIADPQTFSKESQRNYCSSENPRWKFKEEIASDIETRLSFLVLKFFRSFCCI